TVWTSQPSSQRNLPCHQRSLLRSLSLDSAPAWPDATRSLQRARSLAQANAGSWIE
ncbi:hypothetical protein M9458_048407, partial [Cirrhinus mrigala]